ncbi:hypothetical protein AQJ27_45420 [Streptomyces olivochromogenes]|nr:hypothetical protein AQJ27_45420 [Streptomyces olivochromogenes]
MALEDVLCAGAELAGEELQCAFSRERLDAWLESEEGGHLVPGGADQKVLALQGPVRHRLLPGLGYADAAENRVHWRGGVARARETSCQLAVGGQESPDGESAEGLPGICGTGDVQQALVFLGGLLGILRREAPRAALQEHPPDKPPGSRIERQ